MEMKTINDVDLLLSKLDKTQLADFIRKECSDNRQFQDRFLFLGVGSLFKPDPTTYASRVVDLMYEYSDRHGYIDYRASFDFNRAVTKILGQAEEAMKKEQWEVATAVLTGISSISEDILNSGDDSAGELGAIVDDCFEKWHELCSEESLPERIKSEIFELALNRFNEKDLNGWDWWWNWMQMSIDLADTPEKQNRVFKSLDAIKPEGDNWNAKHNAETAQKYKLEMMSRCGSPDDQVKFMYDNVSNPDFRKRLVQKAWDNGDYEEVLRLATDGVSQDSKYAGLVSGWHKWQYKVYRETGGKDNQLQLAKHFFFKGGRFGDKEFSMEAMYEVLKSLIPKNEWPQYTEDLINEALGSRDTYSLLFIYTREKKWSDYMEYLRQNPSIYNIDNAPQEVKKNFRDEIIVLYSSAVNGFFQRATDRKSYSEGVDLLRNLIKYGGTKEAQQIVTEQKSRTPRRPALIDELSKL